MSFTMFTSTKSENICKWKKRYYLLPYDKDKTNIYSNAPYHIIESEKAKRLVLKKDLSKCRKTNIDMTPL